MAETVSIGYRDGSEEEKDDSTEGVFTKMGEKMRTGGKSWGEVRSRSSLNAISLLLMWLTNHISVKLVKDAQSFERPLLFCIIPLHF